MGQDIISFNCKFLYNIVDIFSQSLIVNKLRYICFTRNLVFFQYLHCVSANANKLFYIKRSYHAR